jgi:hypothetical protein
VRNFRGGLEESKDSIKGAPSGLEWRPLWSSTMEPTFYAGTGTHRSLPYLMHYSITLENCGYTTKLASCWNRDSKPTRQIDVLSVYLQWISPSLFPTLSWSWAWDVLEGNTVGRYKLTSTHRVWMDNSRSQDLTQALKRSGFLRNGNRAFIYSGSDILTVVIMKFTCLSVYLSIHLSIYLSMALQPFCWNLTAFSVS